MAQVEGSGTAPRPGVDKAAAELPTDQPVLPLVPEHRGEKDARSATEAG